MDQSNNIVAAFNALATTAGLLGTGCIIPGGMQWSREHQKVPVNRPYAQIWCSPDGNPIRTSGLSFCQNYLVEIKVWCGADNTVLKTIDAALEALVPYSTKLEKTGFLTENAKTVHAIECPAGLDQEEERSAQQNVGVVRRTWRVLLNQTRTSQ